MAQQFAGATMLGVDMNAKGNLTAYAAQKEGRRLLAVFNKDETTSFNVSITSDTPPRKAEAWRLTAPSPDSVTGVTLGGASMTDVGKVGSQSAATPDDAGHSTAPSSLGHRRPGVP